MPRTDQPSPPPPPPHLSLILRDKSTHDNAPRLLMFRNYFTYFKLILLYSRDVFEMRDDVIPRVYSVREKAIHISVRFASYSM